jgi:hypothetical protein
MLGGGCVKTYLLANIQIETPGLIIAASIPIAIHDLLIGK